METAITSYATGSELDPFLLAALELRSGLLPELAESSLNEAPTDEHDAITKSLIENHLVAQSQWEAYFADYSGDLPTPLLSFSSERNAWRGYLTVGSHSKGKVITSYQKGLDFIFQTSFCHEVGPKDGRWISPVAVSAACLQSKRRKAEYVETIHFGVFDEDTGLPTAELIDRISKLGVAALIATTHSHGKSETEVSAAKFDELAAEGKTVSEILRHLKSYMPEVCAGATAGARIESDGASAIQIIHHQPCPRHRIAVPYARPLRRADFSTHRDFVAAHKTIYAAVAAHLGIEQYDKACSDVFRIFYQARRSEGAEYFSIELPGIPLDPFSEEVQALKPPVEVARYAKDRSSSESLDARSNIHLPHWVVHFGKHFRIVDALEARYPAAFFGSCDSDGWFSIMCPTDSHTQNGGTHVRNPSGDEGFYIHCKHATCAGEPVNNDRLNLLAAMLKSEWLSESDLCAREFFDGTDEEYARACRGLKPRAWPDGIYEKDGKLYFIRSYKPGANGGTEPEFEFLCDAFDTLYRSHNEDGEDWSLTIEFKTGIGRQTVRVPLKQLHTNAGVVREALVSRGLCISASAGAKARFDTLLSTKRCDECILLVKRPGFHAHGEQTFFVTPLGTSLCEEGASREVLLLPESRVADVNLGGTFNGWYEAVEAVIESGNDHWLLGVLSGFAGTVIALTGMDTCGLAFSGESSRGKTTLQRLGCSVWGNPAPGRSLLHTLRSTSNAFENLAARGHATTLQLDELGHLNPQVLGEVIFGLTGGVGKARQRADSSMRLTSTWSTFVVLSSERGLSQIMKDADKPFLTGQSARLPDVGVGDMSTVSAELMARIEACKHHYGHAGPDFVGRLFKDGYVQEPHLLREEVHALADCLAGKAASPPVRRAALPFAILWRCGQIAQSAGLIPLRADLEKAIRWGWNAYLAGNEAQALDPMTRAFAAMRTNISIAFNVDLVELKTPGAEPEYARKARWGWYDADYLYIIKDRLEELAGKADKPQAIAKALHKAGFLRKEGEKYHHARIPKRGEVPCYRLHRRFLGEHAVDE